MTPSKDSTQAAQVADPFFAVQLLDAAACARHGCMGISWWHDMVRKGEAPAPVMRQPRCTRWRAVDVYAFWHARATGSTSDPAAAAAVLATANKASAAAQAKRHAAKAPAPATRTKRKTGR